MTVSGRRILKWQFVGLALKGRRRTCRRSVPPAVAGGSTAGLRQHAIEGPDPPATAGGTYSFTTLIFGLIRLTGAGGELCTLVFIAPARALVRGSATRGGVWTTALIAHLRC
jgi:hypothetical protein